MCLWADRKPGPPSQKRFLQRDIRGKGRQGDRSREEMQRVNGEACISERSDSIKKLPCPLSCPSDIHIQWRNFHVPFKSSSDLDPQG